jgi:hypothetical protein
VRAAFDGNERFTATSERLAPVGARACSCSRSRDELLSYRWVPSRCALRAFDTVAFCALLGRRRLLFVGDSTMQQLASVVMNHLAWAGNASCAPQLSFGHADTLVSQSLGAFNRGLHWLEWTAMHQPDVVVLGATAHICALPVHSNTADLAGPDPVLARLSLADGMGNFTSMLHEVARGSGGLAGRIALVWATSVPGGCGPKPLTALPGACIVGR